MPAINNLGAGNKEIRPLRLAPQVGPQESGSSGLNREREHKCERERERVPGREGARSLLQVRMGGLSCHKGLV